MLSVIIVAYRSEEQLAVTLPALRRELQPEDEVIVIDNTDDNVGFGAGCNRGAAQARGDLLVFLNPDAVPLPGWGRAIREPMGGPWVGWQALVVSGDAVNAGALTVHFTAVTWASTRPEPAPREVAALSGACMAVRADAFRACGGFAEDYFLYHEDVDLSLRLRLAGGRLGVQPSAQVDHEYQFHKGAYKWRHLERNRWATVVRCWPGPVLAAALPVLLATELGIWAAAAAGGWAPEKARATREAIARLPRWRRERREIQRARTISPGAFAAILTGELDSPYLGPAARLSPLLRAYWALVRRATATRTSGSS